MRNWEFMSISPVAYVFHFQKPLDNSEYAVHINNCLANNIFPFFNPIKWRDGQTELRSISKKKKLKKETVTSENIYIINIYNIYVKHFQQDEYTTEVLGRNNHLLSFDTTRRHTKLKY
jgi:hypothetical protein